MQTIQEWLTCWRIQISHAVPAANIERLQILHDLEHERFAKKQMKTLVTHHKSQRRGPVRRAHPLRALDPSQYHVRV